jgi:Isocitrate/isopropylmalate dehydrogenase
MTHYRLGILEGDDIGLEIVPVTVKVLKAALQRHPNVAVEWVPLPVGAPSYAKSGETLPQKTLDTLYELDGWILGPIGHMNYPKNDPKAVNPHPIIRRNYDMVSNIRPSKSLPGVKSIHKNMDVIIVRENNEGFQPDRNMFKGAAEFMPTPDMAMSMRVITRRNSEMVARCGFELARMRGGMKKVTAIHKNTVFKLGCGLFVDSCREVAKEYPDIEFTTAVVDTFAMQMIMYPERFDVVVSTNMFGDILTDEAAGLVGGLGMAPGLSVGPKYIMAQATHGSAPDIAGKGIANPYAMIMSGQMMLAWLGMQRKDEGMSRAADAVEKALADVIAQAKVVTPDLGGKASTSEMGDEVCRLLQQ